MYRSYWQGLKKLYFLQEDKGSKQESEKEKLLLQVDNLKTHVSSLEANLSDLQEESKKRGLLLDKSEAKILKTREKMDLRRNEYKNLENELQDLINKAGVRNFMLSIVFPYLSFYLNCSYIISILFKCIVICFINSLTKVVHDKGKIYEFKKKIVWYFPLGSLFYIHNKCRQ